VTPAPPGEAPSSEASHRPIIGVLGLQGDVREHRQALVDVGAEPRTVRKPAELRGLQGIVLPGGESTTLSLLLESSGLFDPLAEALEEGLPAFGTCAGLLLLSAEILDGRSDQRTFKAIDLLSRRNAYGRQIHSFEGVLSAERLDAALDAAAGPSARWPERGQGLPAVFIRAPVIEAAGPVTEVLAALPASAGRPASPVVARQGSVLVASFHPELTGDRRLHRLFASMVAGARPAPATPAGAASDTP
jgi:5'-phosphate synthase pdxT subunit